MSHEFELIHDIDIAATPEQVWDAIATGPGIDSWFMGKSTVEPRVDGRGSLTMPGFTAESTVTAWDPPHHFAYKADAAEDGAFMAFEYLVEGRDGGSTAVRLVHSGIMTGDWEEQYDALRKGNPLYLRTLEQYLLHFTGCTAVPVAAFGPPQSDQERAWSGILAAVGLTEPVSEGDKVQFTVDGQDVVGVVDVLHEPGFLGVRTDDALLRFVGGGGMMLTGHHIFADIDQAAAERTWTDWLAAVYS